MLNVSLFNLEKVKQEAKKLKAQFPTVSYGQRLDIASKNILKVRDYHEAKTLCNKHVNQFVNKDGGHAYCSYCHLSFVAEEKNDIKEHKARHLEYEKVEHRLGFLPAPYLVREKNKRTASKELDDNNPTSTKLDGALRLIRAHFDRSLESAIDGGYWREHPSFENYVAMVYDYPHVIPPDIMKQIRNTYGKVSGQINPGETYWFPQKNLKIAI